MARASKEERKRAIDNLPDLPGSPGWRLLGPFGPAIPVIPSAAKELAKFTIDHEESIFRNPVGDDIAMLERSINELNQRMNEIRGGNFRPGAEQPPKKKRKVSPYSKEFGIQLKKLKKKHPRTPVTRLMKRAHAATRKKLPKKKGKASKGRRRIAKSGQFRRDKLLPRKR